ncbi:MAG: hypothetical protein L0Y72_11945 [Gemmataceae bacterium]|nr:hypothetical protein [Gemmataceae bacterium]MCI0739748.1 hypothetical protein [Gemmataceae bacterium]
MNTVQGTWKNGQVQLDGPTDWPEGCRVLVEPVVPVEKLGLSEDEWPKTPAEIAVWLNWFDSVEPVEITPQEEAEWQAARQKIAFSDGNRLA